MSVLVDTSVWVDHFRHGNHLLVRLLESDRVLIHPLVLAEIACGTPPEPRAHTLANLQRLQVSRQATLPEVMALIEREHLFGQGCGVVDLSLLASALITPGARSRRPGQRMEGTGAREKNGSGNPEKSATVLWSNPVFFRVRPIRRPGCLKKMEMHHAHPAPRPGGSPAALCPQVFVVAYAGRGAGQAGAYHRPGDEPGRLR
jgi:hypothetical protein